jgi:hypothetical protein
MNQVPVSIRSPIATAASTSRDHTQADRPYGESFISAIASSSPDTFMIPTTGPNDSSRITLIEWSTPTNTVGPTYGVPGREPAKSASLVIAVAPRAIASSI